MGGGGGQMMRNMLLLDSLYGMCIAKSTSGCKMLLAVGKAP